jgi:hypothetical protein
VPPLGPEGLGEHFVEIRTLHYFFDSQLLSLCRAAAIGQLALRLAPRRRRSARKAAGNFELVKPPGCGGQSLYSSYDQGQHFDQTAVSTADLVTRL